MASPFVDVVAAVATAINAETWTSTAWTSGTTATRSYATWKEELKDMGVLHVDVVGHVKPDWTIAAEGAVDHGIVTTVGLRKRCTRDSSGDIDPTEIDGLIDLYYEILEFFQPSTTNNPTGRRLAAVTDAAIEAEPEIVYVYNPAMLTKLGQYQGMFRLRWIVNREQV